MMLSSLSESASYHDALSQELKYIKLTCDIIAKIFIILFVLLLFLFLIRYSYYYLYLYYCSYAYFCLYLYISIIGFPWILISTYSHLRSSC